MPALAMDGFESYCRSKSHPNHITTLVGADSQLIYACIYTALRRKGSVSTGQKAMRARIDAHRRLDPGGIEHDCAAMPSETAPSRLMIDFVSTFP
jgi:hypothetical protein